jgi:hypothetical protein
MDEKASECAEARRALVAAFYFEAGGKRRTNLRILHPSGSKAGHFLLVAAATAAEGDARIQPG